MVLALEFWTPPLHFLTYALANLLFLVQNCLRFARPAEARPEAKLLKLPLTITFLWLKTPGNCRDILGDQFAPIESSRNPKLTMSILDFHNFSYFGPPKKVMKIQAFPSPFKTLSPGTMPR